MNFLGTVFPKAQAANRRIVLPKGQDPRIIAAAIKIKPQKIATPIVLATKDELDAAASRTNWHSASTTPPPTLMSGPAPTKSQRNSKMHISHFITRRIAWVAIFVCFLVGCVTPPEWYGTTGVVHRAGDAPLDQVVAEAHAIGNALLASHETKPMSYPRDGSFLIGVWEGVFEIHNYSRIHGGNTSNTDISNVRYEFRDDGTYTFSASRTIKWKTPGFYGSKPLTHSGHGTWSYSNGQLKQVHYQDGETNGIATSYMLLWYGNNEFEWRSNPEQEMSLQMEFLKDILLRQEMSVSDKGVSVLVQQLKVGRSSQWNCSISLPNVLRRVSVQCPPPTLQSVGASQESRLSALSAKDYDLIEHKKTQGTDFRFVYVINNEAIPSQQVDNIVRKRLEEYAENDFLINHPGIEKETVTSDVSLDASSRSPEGKRLLVYAISPYSTQPLLKKWSYDAVSRRGYISLEIQVIGRAPSLEPEQWAHKFIGNLVQFKNVALEAGKAPPPGAIYRSLGESFEDGILTVEFEAVQ